MRCPLQPLPMQAVVTVAAGSTQYLHDTIAAWMVPEGGLTLAQLESMDGQELPALAEGQNLTVATEPNATDPEVGKAGLRVGRSGIRRGVRTSGAWTN